MIPYSGKLSRGPIFMVFKDDPLTTKIKPAKLDFTVHNGHDECVHPRKLMAKMDHL